MTKANVGKAIAIVLDGVVYSAPRVNGDIDGGSSQISGNFTIEDTKDLANTLKSGQYAGSCSYRSGGYCRSYSWYSGLFQIGYFLIGCSLGCC